MRTLFLRWKKGVLETAQPLLDASTRATIATTEWNTKYKNDLHARARDLAGLVSELERAKAAYKQQTKDFMQAMEEASTARAEEALEVAAEQQQQQQQQQQHGV
eukprot:COSAG01_NODE_15405_length_1341_cov_68.969404_1_plen_104_part_00